MSKAEKIQELFTNYKFFDDFKIIEEKPQKIKKDLEKKIKKKYKALKYVCDHCGAFNHKNQGICGICMSPLIRKATKREIYQSIDFIENYRKSY
ncbi:MAG: hypothetical protein EU539_07660 [Promethearchaeota archaeon]|nr:MAG: hypothetical protein EU539_07660 [Candidatus Lokiarchaeota archaeon]